MSKPFNSGLFVTIALPLFAIGASMSAAVVAFSRGDPTLPDEYHWEGMSLDRDFADAQRASDLDVRAALHILPAGTCRVTLEISGARPRALRLSLVHGSRPDLDRQARLDPVGNAYEGPCGDIPPGQWHLALSDIAATWSIRQDVSGALEGVSMDARPSGGLPDRR